MAEASTSTIAPRIAIIGGGISGLTAAYRLSKLLPAAQLELFEASARLGGMLFTQRHDQLLLELGADSFIDKLPAAVDLCRELGLHDQIIPTNAEPRRALVLHGGKLHPVPTGFVQMRPEKVGPMLRTKLLTWRGKLRLLRERWISSPSNLAREDYDESIASFSTRRLGREVFQRLVQPLLAGIYTADPYQLSVAATMPTAIDAERQHGSLTRAAFAAQKKSQDSGARYASFVTLRGGLGSLIAMLEDQLPDAELHLNTPGSAVTENTDRRWSVVRSDGADLGSFDGVVVALPAPVASRLLHAIDKEISKELGAIPYASSAVAVFAYQRDQITDPMDGFGIVIPTIEGRQIVAVSFSSLKFPDRAPDDQVLIRVFVGGALQPELLEGADAEIVQLAQSELSDILGIRGEPVRSELIRWNEKMPQYHVGHLQRVQRIEDLAKQYEGLELAGNAYRGVGIPQCVQSGADAARRLCESLTRI